MKKAVLISVIFCGFALVSCKKDYTCDCTAIGGSTQDYDNLSKESAEEFKVSCESGSCTWSQQ